MEPDKNEYVKAVEGVQVFAVLVIGLCMLLFSLVESILPIPMFNHPVLVFLVYSVPMVIGFVIARSKAVGICAHIEGVSKEEYITLARQREKFVSMRSK
jgi:O-antigen/teichoic acid export membrane protein